MPLHIPQRTVADTGSFPVDPEGVAEWLKGLNPLGNEAHAHEIHRGLKHSNRLHNDVDRRRQVISCFVPVLRQLQEHLTEASRTQPLPLNREAQRQIELAEALLREEAFAFSLLLHDSEQPRGDDARRAMRALARQAECILHNHRTLPAYFLKDAHDLYLHAEAENLLESQEDASQRSFLAHYHFILLASMADTQQHRIQQLARVFDLLRKAALELELSAVAPDQLRSHHFAVDLDNGGRPVPANWFRPLGTTTCISRWFSIEKALAMLDKEASDLKELRAEMLAPDRLERITLKRLQQSLLPRRGRRTARRLARDQRAIRLGLPEISATLMTTETDQAAINESHFWQAVNISEHGLCLSSADCLPSSVQVGELVSIGSFIESHASFDTSVDTSLRRQPLGCVRWVRIDDAGLSMGVELLARSVLPVMIHRQDDRQALGTAALVLACKVKNEVLQTILLPPYQYQVGDRLVATQGQRYRELSLHRPLQSNSQFSHFSLA